MVAIYDVLKASKGIHVDDTFAELWGRKLSNAYTVATYSGTLPATLQTVAGYLKSYKIYGNTVQDGTPTPENPIVPSGCGERTGNLLRCANTTRTTGGNAVIEQIAGKSEIMLSRTATNADTSLTIDVLAELGAGTYTLSAEGIINRGARNLDRIYIRDENNNIIANNIQTGKPQRFTVSEDVKITKLSFVFAAVAEYDNQVVRVMLNLGTAPLPYEPFGYKLPLTVNGVEYPIYLGGIETTRRIKRLVLTGTESWTQSTDKNFKSDLPKESIAWKGIFCTHFSKDQITYNSKVLILRYNNTNLETSEEVKSYLAAQYAAGTPVTVWYVLAKPETGIVNEPLMKIGDYVDTIDSTQTSVQIPTAAGETTISWAGEGLAPSEVELTYRKSKGQ